MSFGAIHILSTNKRNQASLLRQQVKSYDNMSLEFQSSELQFSI